MPQKLYEVWKPRFLIGSVVCRHGWAFVGWAFGSYAVFRLVTMRGDITRGITGEAGIFASRP